MTRCLCSYDCPCGTHWEEEIPNWPAKADCPNCRLSNEPQTGHAIEETAIGPQVVAPFYAPPSTQERVQHLASLPYSQRKSRAEKARPMDRGLFDVEGRLQLDWLDNRSET